ncbi:MAG: tRNA (guanosine(46)-N7)-methyltransferase TrmB [Pirellulales bacterium]|nr:tRNA (guanosine(46)-N7)-methyltransferase TrmB [Pirellulales bacterium]
MARRALRKIDPTLDLDRYLKLPGDLPRPWDAEQLFGRLAPLEVEVGSGKGLFMESAATTAPTHSFLGIEIATKYARFAAAKLARQQLANAVMVQGDAQPIFADLLPANSLAAVHVYFPDPWWKKRHHKRRVLNEVFVAHVERVLVPGGSLHYWTDVHERFDETLELLATKTALAGPLEVVERPAMHELDYRTHFERRMRLAALPVYRAEFRKA